MVPGEGHDLHALGQHAAVELLDLGLQALEHLARVLALAHDDDAGDHVIVLVLAYRAQARQRADLHLGHVAHQDRIKEIGAEVVDVERRRRAVVLVLVLHADDEPVLRLMIPLGEPAQLGASGAQDIRGVWHAASWEGSGVLGSGRLTVTIDDTKLVIRVDNKVVVEAKYALDPKRTLRTFTAPKSQPCSNSEFDRIYLGPCFRPLVVGLTIFSMHVQQFLQHQDMQYPGCSTSWQTFERDWNKVQVQPCEVWP